VTAEERALKLLNDLVGEETTQGVVVRDPGNDPRGWKPRHDKGGAYRVILAAVRAAEADVKEACARRVDGHAAAVAVHIASDIRRMPLP
jgi:hypothetical protein